VPLSSGVDLSATVDERGEAEARCEVALEALTSVESDCATLLFMEERLRQYRPHYPRKLTYLRSSVLEVNERLEKTIVDSELALASAEQWKARRMAEHVRLKAQSEEHARLRKERAAQLHEAGSARRKRAMELVGAGNGNIMVGEATTERQRDDLGQVVALDNEALEFNVTGEVARAAKRAEQNYYDASVRVDSALRDSGAAVTIARAEKLEHERGSISLRTAFEKITLACDAPAAHAAPFSARMAHALQYIMDQLEALETFEGVERDRVALMERSKEKIIRLQLDLASVRETGDAARAEFDETLDAVAARISAAEARCREARRGVERVEGVALGAVASLEASAELLSNPVVCNQLPDKVRGAVLQRTRQLLEVRRAMEKLRARETAPEKTARFAGIELGDLKREGHSLDQATGSSSDGGGGGGGADCRDTRSDGGSVMGPLRPNPPKRARSNCSQSTVASFASTAASLALEQTLPVESSRSSRPQLRRQKSSGASDGKASLSVPSDGSAMTFITPALAELLGIKLSDGDEEGTGVVDGDAPSSSGPTRRRLSSTISPSKAQATSGGAKGVDAAAGPSGQLKKVKLSMTMPLMISDCLSHLASSRRRSSR
jgi:hypothetical protein